MLTAGAAAILSKLTAIAEAEAATAGLRDELKAPTAQLKIDIRLTADYVARASGGNVTKIHSAGFAVGGDPTPRGPLSPVANLVVQSSYMEGQLRLRRATVIGALNYSIDMATSGDGPWAEHVATTTRTHHTFTSLVPGTN